MALIASHRYGEKSNKVHLPLAGVTTDSLEEMPLVKVSLPAQASHSRIKKPIA